MQKEGIETPTHRKQRVNPNKNGQLELLPQWPRKQTPRLLVPIQILSIAVRSVRSQAKAQTLLADEKGCRYLYSSPDKS